MPPPEQKKVLHATTPGRSKTTPAGEDAYATIEETARDDSLITTMTAVGDIVAGDYRTAAVFEKHGIDFCCGGAVTLAAACAAQGIDPALLLIFPRASGRFAPV